MPWPQSCPILNQQCWPIWQGRNRTFIELYILNCTILKQERCTTCNKCTFKPSFCGSVKAMWQNKISTNEYFFMTQKWTGTNSVTLEKHFDVNLAAFVQLQQVSVYVPYLLPNDQNRVTHSMDSIESNDQEKLAIWHPFAMMIQKMLQLWVFCCF